MTAVTAAMPHSQPARRRRSRWWFAAAVVVVLAIGAGVSWWTGLLAGVTGRPHCVATALGQTTELDPEQAGNAATIAAVAVHRGLPGRAATIGIATAMQESKLRNLDYGDRDSRGLFQQRPSQGWGTVEQIMDPVYASNAFYDVLVKIEGYQNLPITTAAQQVQRSAFPSAYGDHEPAARILASALSGYSTASLSCVLDSPSGLAAQTPAENGLTARAARLAKAALAETGRQASASASSGAGSSGASSGGGSSSSGSGSDVARGTTVTFTVTGAEGRRLGWALAHWAVARAQGLDVVAVRTDGMQWRRDNGEAGWTATPSAPAAGTVTIQVG